MWVASCRAYCRHLASSHLAHNHECRTARAQQLNACAWLRCCPLTWWCPLLNYYAAKLSWSSSESPKLLSQRNDHTAVRTTEHAASAACPPHGSPSSAQPQTLNERTQQLAAVLPPTWWCPLLKCSAAKLSWSSSESPKLLCSAISASSSPRLCAQ
jgi:hypothetical protein